VGTGPLSPVDALSAAWDETFCLLFRPFHVGRWIELSVVCLFLGGGTPTAAFQWGFSILPGELQSADMFLRLRNVITQHLSLIILMVIAVVGVVVTLLYVRCVLRFVLVDAVMKREVSPGLAWRSLHTLGRNYFFWLVGIIGTVLAAGLGVVVLSFPYLSSARSADHPSLLATLWLAVILTAVVLVGLLIAVAVTITDDLVVPLIYAESSSFPAAWRMVWKVARRDSTTFVFYLATRFAVSMGIGVAVLFFLFPVLMSLSSGALITAAIVNLSLRLMGLVWTWNPLTMVLGATALLALTGLLFAVLSVVGMPGQVYLQNYGVRFIASRHPALETLWHQAAAGRQR
jgi:hypothetical protein